METTLISNFSHFNFGVEALFGVPSPQSGPTWRRDWILGPLCRSPVNVPIFVWYG